MYNVQKSIQKQMCNLSKVFLPALDGAVWFHRNLGSEHTGKQKLQGERHLEFYQRVFANLEGSQANRSLIKSLHGEFTQAGPENSSEGFPGHPGWAQASSRSISSSQIHLTIQWVLRHYP